MKRSDDQSTKGEEVMKKDMNTRSKLILALSVAGVILLAAIAHAAVAVDVLAVSRLPSSALAKGLADVHIVKGTMQPGDVIPWHIHSGYVFVTVTQGTLTRQESCGDTTDYSAGQGWSEEPGDIHQAVNNGKEAVVFYATYVLPAGYARSYPAMPPLPCQ
jgi:quercetin dioxygenase-like cupin family protein